MTVQSGDTVWDIAMANNSSVDQIIKANNLANADLIFVGDKLTLPDMSDLNTPASTASSTASTESTDISTTQPTNTTSSTDTTSSTASGSGSTYDQFISAGGTDAMWNNIVMPESAGNVDATNGQYHGLGQTNQSWGYGSVATQTQGMLNYATSRYGSVENALSFRSANNWW